jgi:fibro-slime domain-containing protein
LNHQPHSPRPFSPVTVFIIIPALLLSVTAALADDGCGCNGGDDIVLTGIVRDFREATATAGHEDFERSIVQGPGHYTGNIDVFSQNGAPVFVGGGQQVITQCTDAQGRPIAPHLCNQRFVVDSVLPPQATSAILQDSQGVDAFEINFVSATFNEDGTSTWIYNVEELDTGKDLSHWMLILDPAHVIAPGTTPGYDLGVDGSTGYYGIKWDVNESFSEQEFVINLQGHVDGADSTCSVVAKGGNQADHDDLFAPTTTIATDGSPFTVGTSLVTDPSYGDTPTVFGVDSNGGIGSAWSFRDWYRDNPPTNMSKLTSITMTLESGCSYVFDAATDSNYSLIGGFFPVDDVLFGNSGGVPDHNYHFTFEVRGSFTYDASADQHLRFTGDDDVWVFIDGRLGIDLGGIHTPLDQHIPLDRMGLTDGQTYRIDMFFAERHRTQSNFRIETNFCVTGEVPTVVSAIYD